MHRREYSSPGRKTRHLSPFYRRGNESSSYPSKHSSRSSPYLRKSRSPSYLRKSRPPPYLGKSRSPPHSLNTSKLSPRYMGRSKSPPRYLRSKSPSHNLKRSKSPSHNLKRSRSSSTNLKRSRSPSTNWKGSKSPSYLRRSKSPPHYLARSKSPQHFSGRGESPPFHSRKSESPVPNLRFDSSPHYKHRSQSPPYYNETMDIDQYLMSEEQYHKKEEEPYAISWSTSAESAVCSKQFNQDPPDTKTVSHTGQDSVHSTLETVVPKKKYANPEKRYNHAEDNRGIKTKVMSLIDVDEMTDDGIRCIRLSGASKAKIKALVSKKMPYIQAKRMVMKENFIREWSEQFRLKSKQNVTSQIDDQMTDKNANSDVDNSSRKYQHSRRGNMAKDQQSKPPITEVSTSQKPDNATKIEGSLDVTIVHAGYPGFQMALEQLKIIQKAIMVAVDGEGLARNGPQVRFLKCLYGSGYLIITCADKPSADWLENLIPQLEPWEGAELKTLAEDRIHHSVKCTVFVPDENGDRLSAERILNRLEISNKGLNAPLWTIWACRTGEKGQLWSFGMTVKSLEMLKELNMKPYFGFGTLKFRLKGVPLQTTKILKKT